jgi:iron complex transport system substrate-binding protein
MSRWNLAALVLILLLTTFVQSAMGEYRAVVDSRGVEVDLPVEIERVVSVSDGLVEETMVALGVADKLIGLGSKGLQYEGDFTYPTEDGTTVAISGGKHVALTLYPELKDLPLVIDLESGVMNYEMLCSLEPDVVIIRLGGSAFLSCDDENAQKTIQTIESLGIPLIVLYSPNCYDDSDPTEISDEIHIIGELFGMDDATNRIASYLESQQEMIRVRTEDIPDEDKPSVLVFGLSPGHRTETAAGLAWGLKTTESYMIEDVVNAKNAFRSDLGSFEIVSYEQILAMDPDVIVLATAGHYAVPDELYDAPYYKKLRELSAVKDRGVVSLPYSPRNSAKRLEYPVDLIVIAMAAYPERFADIDLGEWLLSFYQELYGVDEDTAIQLQSAQLMDWCVGM